jgi:hypothetical protein
MFPLTSQLESVAIAVFLIAIRACEVPFDQIPLTTLNR